MKQNRIRNANKTSGAPRSAGLGGGRSQISVGPAMRNCGLGNHHKRALKAEGSKGHSESPALPAFWNPRTSQKRTCVLLVIAHHTFLIQTRNWVLQVMWRMQVPWQLTNNQHCIHIQKLVCARFIIYKEQLQLMEHT